MKTPAEAHIFVMPVEKAMKIRQDVIMKELRGDWTFGIAA